MEILAPPPTDPLVRKEPPFEWGRTSDLMPRRVETAIPPERDPDIAMWQTIEVSIWPFTGSPATGTWPRGWAGVDNTGQMWTCTAGGSPGTWAKVGGGGGGGLLQTWTVSSSPGTAAPQDSFLGPWATVGSAPSWGRIVANQPQLDAGTYLVSWDLEFSAATPPSTGFVQVLGVISSPSQVSAGPQALLDAASFNILGTDGDIFSSCAVAVPSDATEFRLWMANMTFDQTIDFDFGQLTIAKMA